MAKKKKSGAKAGKKLTVASVLLDTYNVYRDNFIVSLLMLGVPSVIYFIIYFMNMPAKGNAEEMKNFGSFFGLVLLFGLLLAFINMMLVRIIDAGKRKPGFFMDAAAYTVSRLLPILGVALIWFGVFILLALPMILIAMLKALPLIIIYYIIFMVALYYLLLRFGQAWLITLLQPKVKNSFAESDRICRGRKGFIFLSFLALFLGMLLLEFVLGFSAALLIPHIPMFVIKFILIPLAAVLGAVVFPYFMLFYYALYKKLVKTASRK